MNKCRWFTILMVLLICCPSCRKNTTPPQEAEAPVGETRDLLAADLSNCNYSPEGWDYRDGVLTWKASHGDVWTKAQYDDFILELEWKIGPETNSGIIFRCADPNDWMHTGLEVQIHPDGDGSKHGQVGAIYDLVSPTYYQNAELLVKGEDQQWSIPPVPGLKRSLTNDVSLSVKKVFTNLKMIERNGKQMAYNASAKGESNPAVSCNLVTPTETQPLFVYPDGTRDQNPLGALSLHYRLGQWLPEKDVRRPVGEWNQMRLTAQGPKIQVELNGTQIVDINLDDYTEAGRNPSGRYNKYPVPAKELARRGYISLQDHGKPVWFRNVKITRL